ncbi:sulfotransferase [Salinibacter ruber]|uniref:sulfotransferase n=1 Tax=Salinibacter ruber TaxID=146919 RepID=UPI002072BD38|nr:sulfotransferase [Salinibacter ruber]
MPDLVIGTGLPRSGTTSLSVLLHSQEGACVLHENCRLPFEKQMLHFRHEIQRMKRDYDSQYVGDVAWMWLPYLHVLQSETDASVVAVVREKKPWIESCLKAIENEVFEPHQHAWPTLETSAQEAWEQYYDYAVEQLSMFDVPTFRTSNLSSKETQKEILREAGIPAEDAHCHSDLLYNSRDNAA